MITPDLQIKLSQLGYTETWLNVGILTEKMLESQLQELMPGDDTNKEHYRYRTFITYLNCHTTLSDSQVEQIISLFQHDSDKTMAGSSLAKLLELRSLTASQFNSVSKALSGFGKWTEKRIKNQQAIRDGYNNY
jgi:hypothetical protein